MRRAVLPVQYRAMTRTEETQVLHLWSTELASESGSDAARLPAVFRADRDRRRRTLVAVDLSGRVLSSAWYEPRRIRDIGGAPRTVGCVAAMATQADCRGSGHATRLMGMLTDAMRDQGCDWAMLFTKVPGFYERLRWRRMRTRYRQGLLAGRHPESRIAIRRLDGIRRHWPMLAAIYAAYNADRPLSLVRDAGYWPVRLSARMDSPGGRIVVADDPDTGEAVGYAVVGWYPADEAFEIYELCARPGAEQAIPELLRIIGRHAQKRGVVKGRVYAPFEPPVDSALAELFNNVYTESWELAMAKPIAPSWSHERIRALFDAPGAMFWPLDDF